MTLNVDPTMLRQELTDEERELIEWAAAAYDTLVEEGERPHQRKDFPDEAKAAVRALAMRFHRGTIDAVAPRAFTQCLECGAEIAGGVWYVSPEGITHLDHEAEGAVRSSPLSRHIDTSLCAFFVLMRVDRARREIGL